MLQPAEGKLFALRYRLKRRLGGRGLGEVWEAVDEKLDRTVAVKIIQARFARDKRRVEQFERGAKSVAKLRSPHVVQLLDYGVHTRPFMVLELMDGIVLRNVLDEGVKFPLETAVSIAVQTAKALTAAHDTDIVHRKLEPGNIFLLGAGEDVFVKVFDFGTAKWLTDFNGAQQITTMGAILGSPDYVAPEQISGDERSDLRADVWSLAAIAYHLICGRPPFGGEEVGDVIRKVLTEPHVPPSKINPKLPPDLDAFFDQALAKEREVRFQSALALSQALCDVADIELAPFQRGQAPEEPAAAPPSGQPMDPNAVVMAPILDIGALAPEDRALGLDSGPGAVIDPTSTESALAALDPGAVRSTRSEQSLELPESPPADQPSTLSVDLPSTKAGRSWLVAGAAIALVLGGFGAYALLGGGDGDDTDTQPHSSSANDHATTAGDTSTITTEASTVTTDSSSITTSETHTPSATVSTTVTTTASASARPIVRPPPKRWPDDDDIYE